MTDMKKMLDSMEHALKTQIYANAERRSKRAEREEKDFQEKLMRAAANQTELVSLSAKVKGSAEAVRRDQLIAFLMMGF